MGWWRGAGVGVLVGLGFVGSSHGLMTFLIAGLAVAGFLLNCARIDARSPPFADAVDLDEVGRGEDDGCVADEEDVEGVVEDGEDVRMEDGAGGVIVVDMCAAVDVVDDSVGSACVAAAASKPFAWLSDPSSFCSSTAPLPVPLAAVWDSLSFRSSSRCVLRRCCAPSSSLSSSATASCRGRCMKSSSSSLSTAAPMRAGPFFFATFAISGTRFGADNSTTAAPLFRFVPLPLPPAC